MSKQPTIYDVATLAGVSIATVSFSFARPDKVAPATREAVLAAARELAYVPSPHARGLVNGRAGVLGLCSYDYLQFSATRAAQDDGAHNITRYPIFIDEVQRGVQLESWRQGYSLLVRGGDDGDNEGLIRDLASRVDGLAVFPHTVPTQLLKQLAKRIPVISLSEAPSEDTGIGFVTVDNWAAMFELTTHLTGVHHFQHLAFVGSGTIDLDRRFAGFQAALQAAGVPVPTQTAGGPDPTPHAYQVAEVISGVIATGRLPEAFVCATDQHALVAIAQLTHAGLKVPQDIAVTGFDGILASQFTHPALTTVQQPMQQMGAAAVTLMMSAIQRPTHWPIMSKTLPAELVIGQSCGCPGQLDNY